MKKIETVEIKVIGGKRKILTIVLIANMEISQKHLVESWDVFMYLTDFMTFLRGRRNEFYIHQKSQLL